MRLPFKPSATPNTPPSTASPTAGAPRKTRLGRSSHPSTDVDGLPNDDGHELDFFTRDGANQSYFWAYNYDAASKTLTRYLYSQPGGTAVFDEAYTGITKFYAHTYPVTALQDKSSKIYCPLYDNAQLVPGAVRFYGPSHPDIAGGNQITYVRLEAPTNVEDMQLTTATAPSGFTVVLQYTPNPSPSASPTPRWAHHRKSPRTTR